MPLTHTTELRVRYAETDQMGVVYHTHYLVWCEIARTDFIRQFGMTYADMERDGRLDGLITQNVDGLHPLAGSRNLLEIHGNLWRTRCLSCHEVRDNRELLTRLPPRCACEGLLRPDVVWFGEMPREMDRLYEALQVCDLFISIGTSGSVYPAAGFVAEARHAGAHTVELNLEPSDGATLFAEALYGSATEVVPAYVERLLRGEQTR